ncbi:MAG: DUF6916 family protein [Anaerolineae bacterium]
MMLEQLTANDFEQHLNATFTIRVDLIDPAYPAMDTTLVSVSSLGRAPEPDEDRRQAFSLLFLGPDQPILNQRLFAVDSDALGRLDLFLVPVGPGKGGMQYEAVFT